MRRVVTSLLLALMATVAPAWAQAAPQSEEVQSAQVEPAVGLPGTPAAEVKGTARSEDQDAQPAETPGRAWVEASRGSVEDSAFAEVPADFSRYDEGWIVFRYHPSISAQVRRLAAVAEESKRGLTELLGRPVLDRVTVRVGRTPGEMETLAPRGSHYPRYATGVAYANLDLVLLSAGPRYPAERHDLVEIFRHELSHIALHDALGQDSVPRWFNEGLAVHSSGEAETSRIQALWTATLAKRLIPFAELERGFPEDGDRASVAYAQAADLIRFLLRGGQEHRFVDLLDRVAKGQAFQNALSDAYSTDLYSLEQEWLRDVARRYTFWPVLFGGSMVWIMAIGLFGWGYLRRKRRDEKKLSQWAREEAAEDARRALARAVLSHVGPVRVVLAEAVGARAKPEEVAVLPRETGLPLHGAQLGRANEVPKVEHEGGWHTLH